MPTEENKNIKNTDKKINYTALWGALLTLTGVIWALKILGVPVDDNLRGWWCFIILIPSVFILINEKNKFWGILGVIVGVPLLLGSWGVINLALLIALIAPAVLIYIGIKVAMKNDLKGLFDETKKNLNKELTKKDKK
ncbi:hypothetical protein IIY59_01760 [Candidatus Saccharibacteria bacterium]|nr:hypothetical protein [Candidatus Saccharibacteria bacterium]